MKKYFSIILFIVLVSFSSCKKNKQCNGEGTFLGDIELTNQFQIDSFAEFKYQKIDGYLKITAFDDIDLSNLCSLNSIDRLSIFAKKLYSLNGLNNVEEIDGLSILGCDNLTSISELNKLYNLNHLSISGCDKLENISSFNKITSLINFSLSSNEKLDDIEGFSNLKRIYKTFYITQNNSLKDLKGFNKIYSVEGYFEILYNNQLLSLDGLENLSYVRRNGITSSCNSLIISGNPTLKDFCALSNLVELDCNNSPYNHPIYIFEDNAYNPSRDHIASGSCSL